MKKFIPFIVVSFLLSSCSLFFPDISVEQTTDTPKQYDKVTMNIDLKRPFNNPFDQDDIKVDAILKTPQKNLLILPCFYTQGDSLESKWEARFTPVETGDYTYVIRAISKVDTLFTGENDFTVTESDKDGFLHMNPDSYYTFKFSSGKEFRGVGMNLGWEMQSDWKHTYEEYMDKLEENKANFFRTWMCTWNLPLEWTKFNNYNTFIDELANWDSTYYHSEGLQLNKGTTEYTEDDSNRVTIPAQTDGTIVYNLKDIYRFKIKLFYDNQLSTDKIKCSVSENDSVYEPLDIEFSKTSDTKKNWKRIFAAYIKDLPPGKNFLKIEFEKGLKGTPHLANVLIEHGDPKNVLDAPGLGRYYETTAQRLDHIISLAEQKGLYIMLAFDYHGIFTSDIDEWASNAEWRTNPYNAANGGPCKTQTDFFTNAEARRLYKNRLRYLVARWGYSPALGVWEFWNEIDNVMDWQSIPEKIIADWHAEMASYLKSIDLYHHPVSTSIAHRPMPDLWKLKNIDFTQPHNYNPVSSTTDIILGYEKEFDKPCVLGEYAIGWKGPGKDYPVEYYESYMHNVLWEGMFLPSPIMPMTWWWEWHYYKNEYFHFKMAEKFSSLMIKDGNRSVYALEVEDNNKNLTTMGLQSESEIFLWMLNQDKNTIYDAFLTFPDIGDSQYEIRTYNTWTGEYSESVYANIINNKLELTGLGLKSEKDIALWLKPVSQ